MRISAKILKAVADPSRLRLLRELARRPAGVLELAEKLKLSEPNASRHLKSLREAGILGERRAGTRHEQYVFEKYRCEGDDQCLDFGFCILRFNRAKWDDQDCA